MIKKKIFIELSIYENRLAHFYNQPVHDFYVISLRAHMNALMYDTYIHAYDVCKYDNLMTFLDETFSI